MPCFAEGLVPLPDSPNSRAELGDLDLPEVTRDVSAPLSPICTGHLPYNSYQPWPPPSAPLILDLPPPRSESTSSMAFYGNTSFLDNCDDLSLGRYPSWSCPRGSTSAELAWGQLQLGAVISQLASLGGSDKWLHSTITKGFNYSVFSYSKTALKGAFCRVQEWLTL